MKKSFKEEQSFIKFWVFKLVLLGLIPSIFLLTKQLIENKTTVFSYSIFMLIIFSTTLFLFLLKLKTKIDSVGLHYQFFPFHLSYKVINWHQIKSIYTRNYDAINEYGGWGLRSGLFWNNNGSAYNVSGSIGIQIELKNGKKILIGTQKQTEADNTINKYFKNK
ncbi:hypothetical protein [Tenacibaculum geojense]|uniref:Uncharacterized protein n=1 Tax=Tenacibaculum geojense TaxID=915352 RepID=A0ABW3JXW9_9FLAO